MMEEQYISGEEYQAMQHSTAQPRQVWWKWPLLIGGPLVVLLLGFIGGVHFQKHHDAKLADASGSQQMPLGKSTGGPNNFVGGGPGTSGCAQVNVNGSMQQACGTPISGQVTAISATSITLQPSGSSAQTLSITSSTSIIDNGQSVAYTDIKVGDTVAIIASSSNSTQAANIMVNPNLTTNGVTTTN